MLAALLVSFSIAAGAPSDDTAQSEKAAADLLKKRLENEAPEDKALLDGLHGKEIVVVRGSMDHIESVLAAAGIRHVAINPMEVAGYALDHKMIVMVDCPGDIGPQGRAVLERFVRAGGLLYTTDWALTNLIARTFPGTIAPTGGSTGSEVVAVHIDKEDDNLMSSILLKKGSKPTWWLEGGSHPVKVLDRTKVEVLASSPEMGKRYGASPVVVRVRWEDGEIVHVVSHFYRQMAAKGDMTNANVAVDSYEGLTPEQKAAFKGSGVGGGLNSASVESSYSFQRGTANLITSKLKKNKKLVDSYDKAAPVGTQLRGSAKKDGAAAGKTAGTGRLKILKKDGNAVKVRDDAGNEGWLDADAVTAAPKP